MSKQYDNIWVVMAFVAVATLSACANNDTVNFEEPSPSEALESTSPENTKVGESGFTGASPVEEGSEIIFEDDFDSADGIPDPEKWVLCKKSESNWARYLSESYSQAFTKDGSLFLYGEMVDGEYKTGAIETRGKFEFEHGKVECRARFVRMPAGGHTGIWMMPAPPALQWPKSGEIDIMEHLNKDNIIYETVHSWYADDMGHKDDPKAQAQVAIDREDWNIYGVEWTADKITYTVNGKNYLEYPNLHLDGEEGSYQWPFNHPFYLILSQSLGGEGTWAGPISDSELPAVFEIDWIRVTQPSASSSGVPVVKAD